MPRGSQIVVKRAHARTLAARPRALLADPTPKMPKRGKSANRPAKTTPFSISIILSNFHVVDALDEGGK
jgi:hypothetical protein